MSLAGEYIRSQSTSLVRIGSKIDQKIAKRYHGCVGKSFYHEIRFTGKHLSSQIRYLRRISNVVEKNQIMRVQTYGSSMLALVENVLRQI